MRPPGVWAKAERTFFHLRVPARTLRLCVWTFRPCASFRHAEIPNLLSGGPSAGGCGFFFFHKPCRGTAWDINSGRICAMTAGHAGPGQRLAWGLC